ncbi:MAG: CvpA family protein [Pseudomonadota bacterium]|nr:CvpA family protein [Pseudomonadota bacterium]
MADLLFVLFMLITGLTGYRCGLFRDLAQFVIWLPLFVSSVYLLFHDATATEAVFMRQGSRLFLSMVGITFFSSLMAHLLDITIFREFFARRRPNTLSKRLGFFTGAARVYVMVLGAMLAHFTFTDEDIPYWLTDSSVFLKTAYNNAVDIEEYLMKKDVINKTIILYDPKLEEEKMMKERYDKLMQGML